MAAWMERRQSKWTLLLLLLLLLRIRISIAIPWKAMEMIVGMRVREVRLLWRLPMIVLLPLARRRVMLLVVVVWMVRLFVLRRIPIQGRISSPFPSLSFHRGHCRFRSAMCRTVLCNVQSERLLLAMESLARNE